jgi:phosphinothricin acetyltransferase
MRVDRVPTVPPTLTPATHVGTAGTEVPRPRPARQDVRVPRMFAAYRPEVHGVVDITCEVRPATPQDVPGIVAVAATRGAQPADLADRLTTWASDPARVLLVAADPAGVVVGWTMLARWQGHADAPDGWYVSGLTVDPSRRRTGLGSRLLGALLHAAPAGGPVRSVINAGNGASIALHERHGFREVARGATFAGITFTGGTGVLLSTEHEQEDA